MMPRSLKIASGTLLALTLVLILSLFAARPAQAVSLLSVGCTNMNALGRDGWYDSLFASDTFNPGEQVIITANLPAATTGARLIINGAEVTSTSVPGTMTYTFPWQAVFSFKWEGVPAGTITWDVSCGLAPAVNHSSAAPAENLPVPEPFFQNSDPALGVNLDLARQTPHNGVLPIDVFEPHWWGVKVISAARFPKLAGMDLTGVEVRCLNSTGQWTTDHVSVWSSSPTKLEVYVRQHGFCGIFEK